MQSPLATPGGPNQGSPGTAILASQTEFRGPLPPPDVLRQYNEICPGAAERVFRQFEQETQHRHSIEDKIVDSQVESQRAAIPARRLGQIFAFVIAILGLLTSGFCVHAAPTAGHAWAGASVAGLSLATLVGVFIYGRQSRPPAKETKDKAA